MIRPVSDAELHSTPEDWRILRALSFYRLVLVTLQLVMYETGYLPEFMDQFLPKWFYWTCVAYAVAALLLVLPIVYRRPRIGIQAHLVFAVDVAALMSLTYACGGVPSGLGMLVLTPAVACSMVLTLRMALMQAAGATLAVFAEEFLRQYPESYDPATFTQAGILGLMFFATSAAASAVAGRARKSEVLAAQAGVDLANLSRVNESIIEHMQTGVVVVDSVGIIRLLNAAASALLRTHTGASLRSAAPALADTLEHWRQGRPEGGGLLAPRRGAEDVIPRFTRLGPGADAPALILLENARALREQAQQMKLAALGRLSASIAHEIRNPLSAISHAGQLLSESDAIAKEDQRLLSMIQRHSARIDKIIRDVLSLSRREAPVPAPLQLRLWLEQAVAQYREGRPDGSSLIRLDRVNRDLRVRFDTHHLQQVLFNLWDNSLEHGSRNGAPIQIELSTGWPGNSGPPHLDIRDDGPGIPLGLQDRVFEPFFTTAHEGTGLGLYLARELCEYNHARLTYRPQAHGACFRLIFPEAE